MNNMGSNAVIHEEPENDGDHDDLDEKGVMCEEPMSYTKVRKKLLSLLIHSGKSYFSNLQS